MRAKLRNTMWNSRMRRSSLRTNGRSCSSKWSGASPGDGSTAVTASSLPASSAVTAVSSLIRNKAELIRNCRLVMERYTDCTEIDAQLSRLGDELDVVVGLTQRWVDENARTAQDQDDFMTKYREYDARYQELQAKVDALEVEKRNRQGRVKRFEVFIQALKKQQGELSDFDDDTWLAVIETVLVRPDGKLVFRFANGLEVEQ